MFKKIRNFFSYVLFTLTAIQAVRGWIVILKHLPLALIEAHRRRQT